MPDQTPEDRALIGGRRPAAAPAEAAWRRRFRAAQVALPTWARDAPDRVLYGSNQSGRFELHCWDLRGGARRQVTDRPRGTSAGRLSPDGETIWWFDDERGGEHGAWMAEPFAGGAPARPAAPGVPPAYPAGLALGRHFAVVGCSGDEGAEVFAVSDSGARQTLYNHREHASVAGLSRDERFVVIEHSEHGDSRHMALRVLDRNGRAVADLWDGAGRGLAAGAWSPSEGDERLLITHERAGSLLPAVWSPLTGEIFELTIELPGEITAAWAPDTRSLVLHHDHAGRGELWRLDLRTQELVQVATPPGTIGGVRVRPDGRLWYAHSSGAGPPLVLQDGEPLLTPPGPLAPRGRPYQDLRAGPAHGFLAEPRGARPHPTVMLLHGGPAAHDRDAFSARVQAWVDHGFAVVMVNYRGSTGYGREWRDALERPPGPGLAELGDVLAMRDQVVGAGIADPTRLVLAGASWGGYLTLLGLGRMPGAWSLGLALVPVADYEAAYEDEMEPLKAFDRALFGGTPAERPQHYRERSPITYAERVAVPVLITAGDNDPRCPLRQVERYAARLRELGKPHELYRFDAGHSSLLVEEQVRQMEAQLAFAHRHLGTPPPR